MKISVAWIFDHIDADYKKIKITDLVNAFNKTTAEIEGFYKVSLDLDAFTLAQVKKIDSKNTTVFSFELNKEILLPFREDQKISDLFLIKKTNNRYSWATLNDFHCEKDGFLPSVHIAESLQSGGWKKQFSFDDYILEVDNKSITHRPDMWGHRGFAREIAATFNLPLISFDKVSKKIKVAAHDNYAPVSSVCPVSVSLKDQTVGKRFAAFYIESIDNVSSSLMMAYRLAITGNRPIDMLVDITNYVMLDISQPMHAFDAKNIKTIEARLAKKGETLILLDDQELKLTSEDYIITDGKKPVSLAGVMGGKNSGVSDTTTSLLLESANFDATTIRLSAARFKLRTEASARFEKTLDPNQNIDAITRFVYLLEQEGVKHKASDTIVSLGKRAEKLTLTIGHDFICDRLGVNIDSEFIKKTLKSLEFDVEQKNKQYRVTIPTFRCTKDVTIKEDIVEELGRFFGYDNIPHELPEKKLEPSNIDAVLRVRDIKRVLAHSLRMREVYNYSFYDEAFLKTVHFSPENTVEVLNSASTNWYRLVTSLIPHLFKNISNNSAEHETLRFFEWGRIWNRLDKKIIEKKSLSGIIFEKKSLIDFYEAKALLNRLFESLSISIVWKKPKKLSEGGWFSTHQTAELFHGDSSIGFAGIAKSSLFKNVSEGSAFIFELDGDILGSYKSKLKKYKTISKYPSVNRDISMLVPLAVTVDEIINAIAEVDKRVHGIELIDLFQKDEWEDKKSLTVGFVIQDENKTLTNEEADLIFELITKKVVSLGASIR